MIPVAVQVALFVLYALLFISFFVWVGMVQVDLEDVELEGRHNKDDIDGLTKRVSQLESDYRSHISKPSDGTRVTVRGDRSNLVADRLDPAKMVTGSFDMSKIKAVTVPPEQILSLEKQPHITVSMLDEASYVREFGGQRDTGKTTITIGVKHD